MNDEITINLRALYEDQLSKIHNILDESLNDIEDETNEEALNILDRFIEEEL